MNDEIRRATNGTTRARPTSKRTEGLMALGRFATNSPE
jgi:hypothetical protein